MSFNIKYAEISEETKLPYVETGAASGVPVIFLHGVTDSWRSYELILPLLPGSIRAFAVTQRGHGAASRPETGYASREMAADVAGFMDAVGLDAAVIVGHSMGSFVAQRFAADYPERTLGLVLVGSFTGCRDNPALVDFVENEILPLTDPVPREFAAEFQKSTIAKSVPEDFFEMAVGESQKVPARVWKAVFTNLLKTDHAEVLQKIKAPTRLIWGELDAYFSRDEQEKLLERIENSELVVYPQTGHAPQWEDPARFAADIAGFVENLSREKRILRQVV